MRVARQHLPIIVAMLIMTVFALISLVEMRELLPYDERENVDSRFLEQTLRSPIMSWRTFTTTFKKSYSSLAQQIVRHKLFVASAIKVFITAAKYKFRRMSYFLVINRYSDMTPEEEHQKLAGDSSVISEGDDVLQNDFIMKDEEIKVILRAELGRQSLRKEQNRRRKRDLSGQRASNFTEEPGLAQEVVIKDWRESGCIDTPYDQGNCNSCYAVSSMSFFEWAFCMANNQTLTPLSAQYLVSCGPQFKQEAEPKLKIEFYGCNKGRSRHVIHFVEEYGLEFEENMPYVAEDTECPIEPDSSKTSKGHIRPNVEKPIRMAAATTQLDMALDVGPVIVNFREPVDFMAYGGGMIEDCYQRGGHAMLIVGRGTEDGRPYLLIKNSFGIEWGLDGFFKFDRNFTQACVKDFILPRVSFPSSQISEGSIND